VTPARTSQSRNPSSSTPRGRVHPIFQRHLLKTAEEHARSFGHNYIGTEHLLLAEIDAEQTRGHGPLLDRQVNRADIAAYLLAKIGTLTTEADALRSIGIDPVAPVARARNDLGVDLEIGGAYSNHPAPSSR
jgi:ATP-dependent Clp protease ATP-binding subunit ClpA